MTGASALLMRTRRGPPLETDGFEIGFSFGIRFAVFAPTAPFTDFVVAFVPPVVGDTFRVVSPVAPADVGLENTFGLIEFLFSFSPIGAVLERTFDSAIL